MPTIRKRSNAPRSWRVFFALLLAMAASPAVQSAWAQDILIFRPVDNAPRVVKTSLINFQVQIEAFSTIKQVRINGEAQQVSPGNAMLVSKQVSLKDGQNKFLVEVITESESASQEFLIILRSAQAKADKAKETEKPDKEDKSRFSIIALLGQQSIANTMKVPDDQEPTPSSKGFLVAIPAYDLSLAKDSSLKFQSILYRDQYDKEELSAMAVAFTQISMAWINKLAAKDEWALGIGWNFISTQYDTLVNAEIHQEDDTYFFASIAQAFAGDYTYDLYAELKNQNAIKEAADPDNESDATTSTIRAGLGGKWGGFSVKAQQSYAVTDAIGKYKDKTATSLALNMGYTIGDLNLSLTSTSRQTLPTEIDPAFGIKPEKTSVTNLLTAAYAFSSAWVLLADYSTETQKSEVGAFNYSNTAYSTSIVFIY